VTAEAAPLDAKEAKQQGNAAFRSGDFATAVRCYTVALTAGANHQLLSNRSASYLALGDYTKVRVALTRCGGCWSSC
jgi:Flp pilus assembly protein TadD